MKKIIVVYILTFFVSMLSALFIYNRFGLITLVFPLLSLFIFSAITRIKSNHELFFILKINYFPLSLISYLAFLFKSLFGDGNYYGEEESLSFLVLFVYTVIIIQIIVTIFQRINHTNGNKKTYVFIVLLTYIFYILFYLFVVIAMHFGGGV